LSAPGGQAERIVIVGLMGRSPAEIVEAALDRVRERLREQRPPG
jgi:hypothetical protein